MPATLTLFALSVSIFFAQIALGDGVTAALGLEPARPSAAALFTYMFPHAEWWHPGLNMGGLLALGRYAEPALGPRRFLAAYLASGIVTGCAIARLGRTGRHRWSARRGPSAARSGSTWRPAARPPRRRGPSPPEQPSSWCGPFAEFRPPPRPAPRRRHGLPRHPAPVRVGRRTDGRCARAVGRRSQPALNRAAGTTPYGRELGVGRDGRRVDPVSKAATGRRDPVGSWCERGRRKHY